VTADVSVEGRPGSPRTRNRIVEGLIRRGFANTPSWVAWAGTAAVLSGAGLIVTTAAIHLHLWLSGYRHVPNLDVLFLAQAVGGFILGPVIAAARLVILMAVGAFFMASSAGGLILSATVGFVGIHDGLDVPWATTSLIVELVGFVLFTIASAIAISPLLRSRSTA
jgi:hypothetical protein